MLPYRGFPSSFYTNLNLYTYANNNPINYLDPYGLGFWGDLWDAKGVVGACMAGVGGLVFTAGLASGNGIVMGVGIGIAAAGGILAILDAIDTTHAADKNLESIDKSAQEWIDKDGDGFPDKVDNDINDIRRQQRGCPKK